MAVGKDIETRGHVVGFREEIGRAAATSEDAFYTWFNAGESKEEAFVRGTWDFMHHIAAPAAKYLHEPHRMTALEIGHGGGRLIAAAARSFQKVFGVDIHDQNEVVTAELARRAVHNVELFKGGGAELPIAGSSIDLVYTFVVLQHVERFQAFEMYVRETARVLKPGGLAVLYFGRKATLSQNKDSRLRYRLDRVLERVRMPKGFEESPAQVNVTNLRVSLPRAKQVARRAGLTVLEELVSARKVPDGTHLYGGQHGLILRKPARG